MKAKDMNIDITAVSMLGAVAVFMTLIVVLLNKRIDDLRKDLKNDIKALQDGQKTLQDGQTQLMVSVAWLMARAGATPDEIAPLRQDAPSGD